MICAHVLAELLGQTGGVVHCLAFPRSTTEEANQAVFHVLRTWRLDHVLDNKHFDRIVAHAGDLAQHNLGLSDEVFNLLDNQLSAIYHLEPDISLLKSYNSLQESNIGSLRTLIQGG
jgi:nonribosomal peptide synthetase DhbF